MKLYIDSGTHSFVDTDDRIKEIEKQLESPDVLFVEDSENNPTITSKLATIPKAPLLIGVMIFWVDVILGLLQPLFGTDKEIEEHIEREYGAERIPTDKSKIGIIDETPVLHIAGNWVLIATFVGLWLAFDIPFLYLVTLPGLAGVALMLTFLGVAHEGRNGHIARVIEQHSPEYDEGCLVTGEDHHEPVAELLENNPDISVLNTTPESND